MAKKLSDDAVEKKSNVSADTFLQYYREIHLEKLKVDEAVSEYRAARKRAKAAGIDLHALSLLESLAKLDPEDATLRMKQLGFYAQSAGMAWATQMDLFGHYDDAKPSEDAARKHALFTIEDEGRFAGAGGESDTLNPHAPGSEEHVAWVKGYRNGRVFFDRSAKANGAETKKPRGRKAKGGNPEDRPAA